MLAVEVHRNYYGDGSVLFGAEVWAELLETPTLLPWPGPIPVLNHHRDHDQLTLSWTGGNWALEWAEALDGPWYEAQPDMSNPYTTSIAAEGSRFWRLKRK